MRQMAPTEQVVLLGHRTDGLSADLHTACCQPLLPRGVGQRGRGVEGRGGMVAGGRCQVKVGRMWQSVKRGHRSYIKGT